MIGLNISFYVLFLAGLLAYLGKLCSQGSPFSIHDLELSKSSTEFSYYRSKVAFEYLKFLIFFLTRDDGRIYVSGEAFLFFISLM